MKYKPREKTMIGFLGLVGVLVLASLVWAMAGCGGSRGQPPPAPPASFVKPLAQQVMEWDEYSGRLESPEVVNLSARVSGIITQASFLEGSLIKAGDLLFVIDERPFKAAAQSAEADVLSARAQLAQAQARFKRYEGLKGTKAISDEDYDDAAATLQQATAKIAGSEAARDIAKLNLEWTRVRAPIAGRISRKLVTEGNLVTGGTGQATPLTIITSVDPMYCYINAPERALLKYKSLTESRKAAGQGERLPCSVQLENEKTYTHSGEINFVDNRIDSGTGTVEMRCSIPNANGFLSSGLFSRMRVLGSEPYLALLIPDSAVSTDQSSRFLLTVGDDDKVVRKSIELGPLFGNLRNVSKGLEQGDRVIIDGLQQLRVGAKVTPQEAAIRPEDQAALKDYLVAAQEARSSSASTMSRAGQP